MTFFRCGSQGELRPLITPKMESRVRGQAVRRGSPPDGGYGWFIVFSCFLVFGLTFGVIKSFGVFYVEIHHYFATTATGSSWITSIAVATIHIGAPVGAALSERFSHRSVVILGGLLSSVGMVAGAYAQNLVQLYITVGFITGFGYALTWTPTVTMLGWYFDQRRPMANALASTGECIITFVLTPLFQLLVDHYSWRGAMLVQGAIQLNLCVCGALLRPLRAPARAPQQQRDGEVVEEEEMEAPASTTMKLNMDSDVKAVPIHTDHDAAKSGTSCVDSDVQRYVDYTLVTNVHFMVYSLFGVFAALGFFAPALFLVPYARTQGLDEYEAAMLVSLSAVLDLIGRVFFGWVANLRLAKTTVRQLTASVLALGTVLLLCPLATTFGQLVAFCMAYGLAYGATVSTHITVLAEVVGAERLGSAIGFFMLIRSTGGLLGPPIAGFFIDKMSDYGTGFLMAGVALIVSALFLLLLDQMSRRGRGLNRKGDRMHPESKKEGEELNKWTNVCQKDGRGLEQDV
ncbi:monocarboxylate transporter 13 isoform X2 [Alosa sapidissima]|uniref:monocarboxylate transporter 13 isoform X2 n=1 Tax=Alosa sapidissima TaxID=34773 RepID=UPI001C0885DC|nr:monocarboxylate transporter 13 isoform X2 [Alosa sapidissima]